MTSIFQYLTSAQISNVQNGVVTDLTTAANTALSSNQEVTLPPGVYGFKNLRIPSGRKLIGSGESATFIHQISANFHAINCLSDTTVGQLLNIEISGVQVVGHNSASVAAVFVGGFAPWTVWNCRFEFFAKNTWRALDVEGDTAANVFNCDFRITSEGTKSTAVNIHGGVYNRYWLFLVQCRDYAIKHSGTQDHVRCVSENCQEYMGQVNEIWPIIESIKGEINAPAASAIGIYDNGFNNTFHSPTVNLLERDEGVLQFAFRPFVGSTYINPQILGKGASNALHPFAAAYAPFTVIGGRGRGNKIETYYSNPVGISDRQFSLVNLVGSNDGLSNRVLPHATHDIAPNGGLIVKLDPSWRILNVTPTVDPLPVLQIGTKDDQPPVESRELIITTTKPITVLQYESPLGDCTALPTSLPQGGTIRAVYSAKSNRWFPL